MRIRYAPSIVATSAVLALGLCSAPAAHAAASPSSQTIVYNAGTFSYELSTPTIAAQIGDTFSFTNGMGATNVQLLDGTGAVSNSIGPVACSSAGACPVAAQGTMTVLVSGFGTVLVRDAGGNQTLATFSIVDGGSSSGMTDSTPAEPPVTAPDAPTVTAVGGDKAVKVTITFGSSGSSPLQYCQVGAVPANSDDVPQPSPLIAVPAGATSMDYVMTGLNNGYTYGMTVVCANAQGQWSLAGTASANTSASASCKSFSINVAQPTGAAVTTPITPTSPTSGRVIPNIAPPYGGKVTKAASGAFNQADSTGAPGGEYATFTITSPDVCVVTLTADEGAKLTTSVGDTIGWNGGSTSLTLGGGATFYAFGTTAGTHSITAKAGSVTVTPQFQLSTVPAAAYTLALSPSTASINTGAFDSSTVTVTDMFGNPVPQASAAVSATGNVLLGGYTSTSTVTTGAAGTASITIVAGFTAGEGKVTATSIAPVTSTTSSDTTIWPWQAGYAKPATIASAPVPSASSTLTVIQPETKSIIIVGERTTVSGKSGIRVDGATTGLAEGDIVNPYVKLAGQTEYTMGVDITVDAAGEFSWQRKTGKKTYVYFKSADGTVKSNTVIIPTA